MKKIILFSLWLISSITSEKVYSAKNINLLHELVRSVTSESELLHRIHFSICEAVEGGAYEGFYLQIEATRTAQSQ